VPISFECSACGKTVEAPDAAAGKRGTCPFCGATSDIPAGPAADEDDLYGLAPLDEAAEQQRQTHVRELMAQESDLLAESGTADGSPPLDQRADLDVADLYHFVINYCLDMASGNLERAQTHVAELRRFRALGAEAVENMQSGKAEREGLDHVPPAVVEGFLKTLRKQLA